MSALREMSPSRGSSPSRPPTPGSSPDLPALVVGTVSHVRHRPKRYAFVHRHSSWLVDLDAPPLLPPLLRVFAHLSSKDHLGGQPDFSALKRAVVEALTGAGIDTTEVTRVVMLAHARALGFVFDPMTAYWALDVDGSVIGAVVEVHNTFGERIAYPLRLDAQGRARMEKGLFVSPFNDLQGWYDVRMVLDRDRCGVWIRLDRGEGPVVSASLVGEVRSATTRAVLADLLRTPLMPMRVFGLIHVHALRLWRRGLPSYLGLLGAPRRVETIEKTGDQ